MASFSRGHKETNVSPSVSEVSQCVDALDRGLHLTRFLRKSTPQKRAFRVKRETRQLVWIKTEKSERHIINLHEVHEIREGQASRDFETRPKESGDHNKEWSFVLFHGSEFRLNTFSAVALNAQEFQIWMVGLRYLVKDARTATYPVLLDRVPGREVKSWLHRTGYKAPANKSNIFEGVEYSGDLNYEGFTRVYKNAVHQAEIYEEFFSPILPEQNITLVDLQNFLLTEQQELYADDIRKVKEHLEAYLESSNVRDPVFNAQTLMDYLYSEYNIVSSLEKDVTQDMSRPLSHYWIASSHNTYLTGDQITSDSSYEAYVRVLRQGCKCIELDCWDGEKEPIIYHGRTLTSKISFEGVLKTIAKHAWDISDYPLILSIENHCCLEQQRIMAKLFQNILGANLLKSPIKAYTESTLPSPGDLKRKIILKHKKLPLGSKDGFVSVGDEVASDDLSQSRMTAKHYLQDPVDQEWYPHFFVLTGTKLIFSMQTDEMKEQEQEEDDEDNPINHRWFHTNIRKQEQTREIFNSFGPKLGDGSFLVRPSLRLAGGYALSFWRNEGINHCTINAETEGDQTKYSLVQTSKFSNIQELVEYYQRHALHGTGFHQVLTKPIPKTKWTSDEYYLDKIPANADSRTYAEDLLMQIPYDGAFLVRKRGTDNDVESYAISFRAEGQIRHCRFNKEDGAFSIGSEQFDTIEELVSFYARKPLFRRMKLKYPTNQSLVDRLGVERQDQIYIGDYYCPPNLYSSDIEAVAIHDYKARSDQELTFNKGDTIYNVCKSLATWWKGDFGDQQQLWFPKNYVNEIDSVPEASLGEMENASIPIKGCSVVYVYDRARDNPHGFRVTTPDEKAMEVACDSKEEAQRWEQSIREAVTYHAAKTVSEVRRQELSKRLKVAVELSDLIVYCQTVEFEPHKDGPAHEMSSLTENKAEKWSTSKKSSRLINRHNIRQFSRVYPKGTRINSSNYDPMRMWVAGCQMVALNYQTPDEPMQLNQGKFADNGCCGYVLKPKFMLNPAYDPLYSDKVEGIPPLSIALTILGARHLPKRGRNAPSPQVQVEVSGSPYDTQHNKATTSPKGSSSLCPTWQESWVFDVCNPELALIRFVVQDVDVFGEPYFLGHATYPVKALRYGFRSVPLWSGYGDPIHMATILVHVELGNPEEDYEEVYTSIRSIQADQDDRQRSIQELKLKGEVSKVYILEKEFNEYNKRLEQKKGERKNRIQQKKTKNKKSKKK